jgi:solute carrier family 25 (mitochondrial oxoglutarate transporter), member 11
MLVGRFPPHPFPCLLCADDQAREVISKFNGNGMSTKLAAAAVAGLACAFTSLPFDLIKTRLQNQKIDPKTGQLPYRGVVDVITKTLQKEGFLALWTGFVPYYGRCAPHAMTILLTIDLYTHLYSQTFHTKG